MEIYGNANVFKDKEYLRLLLDGSSIYTYEAISLALDLIRDNPNKFIIFTDSESALRTLKHRH